MRSPPVSQDRVTEDRRRVWCPSVLTRSIRIRGRAGHRGPGIPRRLDIARGVENGYNPLGRRGRGHATVNHNWGEFARDDDGDGVREVRCNTLEGIWTGLRNFLRPFRGVNKVYLEQYVIIFEWCHNLKKVTDEFLRVLLGCRGTTELVT